MGGRPQGNHLTSPYGSVGQNYVLVIMFSTTKHAAARAEVNALKRPKFDPPSTPLDSLGPFDVVYADPPWRYEQIRSDSRATETHYPTMPLDDIKALRPPVTGHAPRRGVVRALPQSSRARVLRRGLPHADRSTLLHQLDLAEAGPDGPIALVAGVFNNASNSSDLTGGLRNWP